MTRRHSDSTFSARPDHAGSPKTALIDAEGRKTARSMLAFGRSYALLGVPAFDPMFGSQVSQIIESDAGSSKLETKRRPRRGRLFAQKNRKLITDRAIRVGIGGRSCNFSLYPIHAGRMSRRKNAVRILWVEHHVPHAPAGELHILCIDAFPFVAGIGRDKDAAVILQSARDEDLVGVVRIYQNTRKVSEGQIATSTRPRLTVVTADVKCVDRADINIVRANRIGCYRADRNTIDSTADAQPGFSVIA